MTFEIREKVGFRGKSAHRGDLADREIFSRKNQRFCMIKSAIIKKRVDSTARKSFEISIKLRTAYRKFLRYRCAVDLLAEMLCDILKHVLNVE